MRCQSSICNRLTATDKLLVRCKENLWLAQYMRIDVANSHLHLHVSVLVCLLHVLSSLLIASCAN